MQSRIEKENRFWIETLRLLRDDPTAKVPCPSCGEGHIELLTLLDDSTELDYEELILRCTQCGLWNSVLTRVPKTGR